MAQQATITLSALTGNFAQRVVKLTPDERIIQVGRASKSIGKNIIGASDNTWFDSPVMSRTHAEMVLNSNKDPVTVVLRDIGSMHGTCINQTKLAKDQDTQMNSGDILTFGAEVRRGQEVFPACKFRVNLDFATYQSRNTFSCPETDDSSEAGFSELDTDEHEEASSVNGSSIPSSQQYKPAKAVGPIDLTKDETPPWDNSTIDLTVDAGPLVTSLPEPDVVGVVAGRPIVLEENEELYDDLCSVSEDPSEIAESEMSEPDDSDGLSDLDDENMQEDSGSDGMDVDEAQKMTEGVEFIGMAMDNGDDDSDLGLSEAGAEGLNALFEVEARGNSAPEIVDLPATKVTTDALATEASKECHLGGPPSKSLSLEGPNVFSFAPPSGYASLYPMVSNSRASGEELTAMRQPSPSDAALVKMAPSKPASDMVSFPLRMPEAGQLSHSLGEKSGKHAYFEAREQNKSKMSTSIDANADLANMTTKPYQAGRTSLFDTTPQLAPSQIPTRASKLWTGTSARKDGGLVNDVSNTTSGSSADTTGIFSNPAVVEIDRSLRDPFGMPFEPLFSRAKSTDAERGTSPEYDMTSAVTFNESKAKAIRSRLSIHDIIDTASREESPHAEGRVGGKRKASEISDTIQDEVRAWAKNSTVPSQTSDKVSTTPEVRSVKRLKTFMERATYAAVGGVAVGAGLFFSLVATAPNFA